MRHFEKQPYDYELSDAEFYKLMGMENPDEGKQKSTLKKVSERELPVTQAYQSKASALKTWLSVVTTVMFFVFLLSSFSA